MKEKETKGRKALLAIAVTVGVCLTACERPRKVDRTVELHYVNGEVETRVLRGSTRHQPKIHPGYTPYYTDVYNKVYGVVRFRVLSVDTIAKKGGSL